MKTDQPFNERCYELLKLIPQGKVTTYAEIAHALNSKAYRAVGTAMAKNQQLVDIPCHRVVRSDGNVGQYAKGQQQKIDLLIKEGVNISNGKVTDLSNQLHRFC